MTAQPAHGKPNPSRNLTSNAQLVVSFVLPTIVLLFLSDESRLGPLRAMLVALVPPLALELYRLRIRRKPSLLSIMAIVGILFVGAISWLGLGEQWLALRRSAIYILAALGVVMVMHFKRGIIEIALARVINMNVVHEAAESKGTLVQVSKHINKTCYALAALLLIIGIATYIMTIALITVPTNTSEFNTQYAQLRLLNLIFITVPLLAGASVLLIYLVTGLEKFTGITMEELLKKGK